MITTLALESTMGDTKKMKVLSAEILSLVLMTSSTPPLV